MERKGLLHLLGYNPSFRGRQGRNSRHELKQKPWSSAVSYSTWNHVPEVALLTVIYTVFLHHSLINRVYCLYKSCWLRSILN